MDLNKIGKFIAKKRKEKNLTQEQLGEKMGIGGKSVSKWERGLNMPDIENLEQLCSTLDVDVIDILNGEETSLQSDDLNNISFFDAIKYYIKNSKKKIFIHDYFWSDNIYFFIFCSFSV